IHRSIAPPEGPGWGCDSNRDAVWKGPSGRRAYEPSCIPNAHGEGPYRPSPVSYVPTIADRLEAAGRSWGIFGAAVPQGKSFREAYKWSICPSFAECLYGPQHEDLHEQSQFFTDAANGTLPSFSILTPGIEGTTSQHNGTYMSVGDEQIEREVQAVESGLDAQSTTIFIYYDDCEIGRASW